MTTIRRKQQRLLKKLEKLGSGLLVVKTAPQGASNVLHPQFDPDAIYVSKRTLLELIQDMDKVADPSEGWDDPDY